MQKCILEDLDSAQVLFLGWLLLFTVLTCHPGWCPCKVLLFFFFFGCMWDLNPWPGIEPAYPALEACSLNYWTTREVPTTLSISLSLNLSQP